MPQANSEPSVVEETPIAYSTFTVQLGFLKGEVLTVIDACFTDKEQRKAVKDLIHKAFRDRERYVLDIADQQARARYDIGSKKTHSRDGEHNYDRKVEGYISPGRSGDTVG